MASTTIFSTIFFSLLFFISPSVSELCNPKDKKVLLQIKKSFGDPYMLASWKSDSDCCNWYCVTCDSTTHRINSLTIFDGELSGQIPADIGNLPYLTMLDLNRLSNVTGPIQPAIAKLTSLNFLRLSYLNLSGSIPSSLSSLKKLTFLDVSHNDLTGSIPTSLSLLQNLDALHLDHNFLTGVIPLSFGNFTGKVPSLYLSNNKLSGTVPSSLSNIDFDTIDLSSNSLQGDASMLFGPSKTTQTVDISRNMFNFNLSIVTFPTSLTNLDLSHNAIYGSIPAEMTKLANLQALDVSYNKLCGQIPVGGKLQSFDSSSYSNNLCLCGAPLATC